MATSLAAQLKKLAVPEAQSLLAGDHKQASFLYNDQEAATFTKQHFYNIGVNGLQQLIAKDARFAEFEQNLFSQSSQSMQRYVQTSAVNQQLDVTIERFLLRLSSYMQLREAHKAMEWMVHRYNVHLRNVDTFMMCLLPYHDQQPFVMGLQLLKMNSNEAVRWRWLEAVKKGGTFLSRQSLVSHCRSANGFLGFMCDMLNKHVEANTDEETDLPSALHLQRIISFFTQTVLGVLVAGPPSESIVSTLLPVLTGALKSTTLPDLQVSAYMILSQLFMHTSLAQPLLQSFLNVISKNMQPNLVQSALTVIIIMFQKQAIQKVPKKAFRYLVRQPSLVAVLHALSLEARTEPFLAPFLSILTTRALRDSGANEGSTTGESSAAEEEDEETTLVKSPNLMRILLDLLGVVELKRNIVENIVRLILTRFSEGDAIAVMNLEDSSFVEGPLKLFKLLENKYSAFLDSAINTCSEDEDNGKKMNKAAKALFKLSIESARHNLVSDPAASVTICLLHRQAGVRQQAVEALLRDPDLIADKSSIQTSIVLKLQDSSPDVVLALLKEPKKLWALFEDKPLLYSSLVKRIATRKSKPSRTEVHKLLLQTLCCLPENVGDETAVTAIVLSALVVSDQEDASVACSLLESEFADRNKLLSHIRRAWLPELKKLTGAKKFVDHAAELYQKLVDAVSSFFLKDADKAQEMINSVYDHMAETSQPASLGYLILSVTCSLIEKTSKVDSKTSLQRAFATMLASMIHMKNVFPKRTENENLFILRGPSLTSMCLTQLTEKGHVPLQAISHFLHQASVRPVSAELKAAKFWSLAEFSETSGADTNWLHTVTIVVNLLLELRTEYDQSSERQNSQHKSVAEDSFSTFFKVFSEKESVVKFLCMVWMCQGSQGVTVAHSARLLQFAQVYFESLSEGDRASLLSESLPLLPCLLILLSNPCERVREVAFSLLALVTPASGSNQDSSPLHWFSNSILRFRQEVTKDNAFLSQVVKTLLEPEDSDISPPSPKRRKRSASKPPLHNATLTWLLDVVVDAGTPAFVQAGLLSVLSQLDTPESFLPLVPTLKTLVERSADPTTNEAATTKTHLTINERTIVRLMLKRFTSAVAPVLDESSGCLDALVSALKCSQTVDEGGVTVQMLALEQLRSKFVSQLPAMSCKTVVAELLTLTATCGSAEAVKRCRKVIKHMSLEASIVIDELKSVLTTTSAVTVREAKRQRLMASKSMEQAAESNLEGLPWRRVTLLLEMLQSKKKLRAAVSVVPIAFQVLGRVLELSSEGGGEYLKQLLLGLINFVCSRHWDDGEVTGKHLDMNLIVQCIRSSEDAHTHHQALLLLSTAAKIDPSLLLHNMMSVFTFMGTNILRQDDAYSFHVIGRILDNVIPALVMACEEKCKQKQLQTKSPKKKTAAASATNQPESSSSASGMMTVVLRVFVSAAPHIPSHRRMMLFERLLNVVGADQYLWRLILLYIEAATGQDKGGAPAPGDQVEALPEALQEKTSGPLAISDLEFLTDLTERFTCPQLLKAFQESLAYILALPEDRPTGKALTTSKPSMNLEDMDVEEMAVFSVTRHTAKQLRHFKFATVFALNHLVNSQHVVAQLAEADPSSYLSGYQNVLETSLQWIGQVTTSLHKHAEEATRRFWKLLLHKSHDLLDTLVNLLPDSIFFEVVSGLMTHSLSLVQRRAMELLNTRLQQYRDTTRPDQVSMLLPMVSRLQTIASQCLVKSHKSEVTTEDQLVNGQTALYSLKILCKIVGEGHHANFMEVMQLCVDVLTTHSDNGMVSASAMLCIAEVVQAAKNHAIEHLSLFMPLFVAQLQSDAITQNDVLLLATVTGLHKVIEALPLFLSPYLKDIVIQVCVISSQINSNTDSHKPVVSQKIKLICGTLANATPTRTFIPVMEKSFLALEDKMSSCAECAMTMLKDHITKMARDDLNTFCQDLLKFFFVIFDIRLTHPEMDEDDLDIVENCVIEAFVTLVFKLSEAQFKPMLLQIYNWATEEGISPERTLFFYRLCNSLAEKLKSLFTLFAGHILKHSAQMLDATNKNKSKCKMFGKGKASRKKSCRLANHVVDCLQKTFAHDTEGFVTKERFDVVMQPLVDQLENTLGKPSVCEDRAVNHVVPCLASLAAAARDDSLWKDLNYQILLKTRHQEAQVRMRALAALDAFHKQLGEDFTQLVPEAIPFLAELMEDESDEVEKYTQKVLAAMEVSVGENLQEYF